MASHEDWAAAVESRDVNARRAVRALLDGDAARALEYARASDASDDDVQRISRALDGPQ
jgi:hypothetical protein